jgi:hypothetical protein
VKSCKRVSMRKNRVYNERTTVDDVMDDDISMTRHLRLHYGRHSQYGAIFHSSPALCRRTQNNQKERKGQQHHMTLAAIYPIIIMAVTKINETFKNVVHEHYIVTMVAVLLLIHISRTFKAWL